MRDIEAVEKGIAWFKSDNVDQLKALLNFHDKVIQFSRYLYICTYRNSEEHALQLIFKNILAIFMIMMNKMMMMMMVDMEMEMRLMMMMIIIMMKKTK